MKTQSNNESSVWGIYSDHQCEANNQLPQDYCPLNGEK